MGYICSMKKKKKFERPADPWWNPDEEPIEEEPSESPPPVVNETLIQAFVNEWQPESDERLPDVFAFGVGELRERMQIYRTFDCKSPDPLPYYLAILASHGFRFCTGFSGEQVVLVRKRNNGKGLSLTNKDH